MADIFLSYATEDRATASEVASQFEALGFSVWWDRKIPAGMTWRQVIESALNDMGCMVVLWSANSLASTWVSEEAEEARMRGKLVPALLEPVLPPLGFRGIQAADLVDWDGSTEAAGFRHLVAGIEALLAPRSGGKPVAPAVRSGWRSSNRARPLAVAGGCLLLLLTAGTWVWNEQREPPAAAGTRSSDGAAPAADASPRAGAPAPATAAATGSQSSAGGTRTDNAPPPQQPPTITGAGAASPLSPASPASPTSATGTPAAAATASTASGRDSETAARTESSRGTTTAASNKAKPLNDPAPTAPTAAPALASGAGSASRSARLAVEPGARAARPARCRDLLERQSLGDPLSAEERTYFQKECRT
ncbi:MAG: toll/interleukin-1 receptor domain-containing protein [Candidatus Accumulibacter sp.]|uniref:toll/interleukin-1 receptor domain-containing protein n=1 Tax=Accumulibacter sp. TaxID=2053492 RepID=UPI001B0E03D6|nr:toll/interleukin-1 receptor domain-containing protein [Accumulibacter sp.]MBO3715313.1 toll/interleukin-1 receptor domain-containing protein [Accumulibacter sp.]